MNIYNKIKWILGIFMIFVLILATNLIDKNNFSRVRDSVVTIYEDRLIAKDLIFKISNSLQEKELVVVSSNINSFKLINGRLNNTIKNLIAKYELTKLTKQESIIFDNLKDNFQLLKGYEKDFKDTNYEINTNILSTINNLKENLNQLSEIQLNEANRQMSISKKAMDTIELFTKIEIYILILLAVIIQIIIMYKPKEE